MATNRGNTKIVAAILSIFALAEPRAAAVVLKAGPVKAVSNGAVRAVSTLRPGDCALSLGALPGQVHIGLPANLSILASLMPLVREEALSGQVLSEAAGMMAAPVEGAAFDWPVVSAPEAPLQVPAGAGRTDFPAAGALGSAQFAAQAVQTAQAQPRNTSRLGRFFSRFFDGSAGKGSRTDNDSGVSGKEYAGASYLGRAPEPVIPDVASTWQPAGAATEKDLATRQEIGPSEDVVYESGAFENFPANVEEVSVELPEPLQRDDKAVIQKFMVTGGVKFAAMINHGLVWADNTGNVFIHWRATARTLRFMLPAGKLGPMAVSEDGRNIYAVVDGRLTRWSFGNDGMIDRRTVKAELLDAAQILALEPVKSADASSPEDGVEIVMPGKRLFWKNIRITSKSEGPEQILGNGALRAGLEYAGNSLYFERLSGTTRVWVKPYIGSESRLEDLGFLPLDLKAIVASPVPGIYFAVAPEGLVEWDVKAKRYRVFSVPGLAEAVSQGAARVDLDPEGRVLAAAGYSLFQIELAGARRFLDSPDAEVRLWSQANPMYVKDGALHIGDFSFPLAKPAPRPLGLRWWDAFKRLLGLAKAPQEVLDLGVSEQDWQALNLPSNKRLIYDTLSGFSVGLHALYVGETGGGKTWIAERVAKLTANKLWLVSFKEHTRAKDFIYRETFGEEGKGRTGLTYGPVLRWMIEGGVLVLDEIHKPLEGVADLNNILANGEFQMPDGTIIKLDPKKSFVIATMNPVKPPYRGEPPSGELASRFGMTKEVNYLPEEEEYGLLRIFFKEAPQALLRKLVGIANELRPLYPDPLGLPIASRTLVNFMKYMQAYPDTDAVNQFMIAYNPVAITQDLSAQDAIKKVLEAHQLAGESVKPQEKK